MRSSAKEFAALECLKLMYPRIDPIHFELRKIYMYIIYWMSSFGPDGTSDYGLAASVF